MNKRMACGIAAFWAALGVISLGATASASDLARQTYSTLVDSKGHVSLPKDYRQSWTHLGSWLVPAADAPGHGFHDVYTQPEAVAQFRRTGKFPDGAVLIKEIRAVESGKLTTGAGHWAGKVNVWFVMVKDAEGRFAGNPHWGKGWGWTLHEAKAPEVNASKGFKETCLGCHMPVKDSDWVFLDGYRTLDVE